MSSSGGKPTRPEKGSQAGPGGGRPRPPRPRPPERPPVPVQPGPQWSRSQRILLGAGLGALVVIILAAAVFVGVQLSRRVARSTEEASGGPETPGAEPTTLPAEPQPAPPGESAAVPREGLKESGPPIQQAGAAAETVPVPGAFAPAAPPTPEPESKPPETIPPDPRSSLTPGPSPVVLGGTPAGLGPTAQAGTGPPQSMGPPSSGPPPSPPTPTKSPLDEIRANDRFLPLPPPADATAERVELAKVHVDSPSDCDLSILGSDVVLGEAFEFVLKPVDTEDGARTWPVQLHAERGLAGDQPVGTFQMKDDSLRFAWNAPTLSSAKPAMLRYCLLEVKAGGESERCFLTRPDEVVPDKLRFSSGLFTLEPPLDPQAGPDAASVRLDLELEGFPPHEIDPPAGWKPGETGTIRVSEPGGAKAAADPLVEIQIRFRFDDKCQLLCRTFALKALEVDDPPNEKPQIGRSSLRRYRQKWGANIKNLKRTLAPFMPKIQQLAAQQKALEGISSRSSSSSPSSSYEKLRLERELQQGLAQLGGQQAQLADALKFYESLEAWAEGVEKLFDHLEAQGRLGYRIYIEIDGEEVEILRTKLEDSDSQRLGSVRPGNRVPVAGPTPLDP